MLPSSRSPPWTYPDPTPDFAQPAQSPAYRGEVGAVRCAVVAILAVAALGTPHAAARSSLQTPGYRGITRAPPLLPQEPLSPITISGAGVAPNVLVDAAGTAHIVWNEGRGADQDVLRYCRLKRGARECDAGHSLIPPLDTSDGANSPQSNADFDGPRVVALGDELGLLTRRAFRTTGPDGETVHSPMYLFLSQDGGTTFNPPAMVGTGPLSGEPGVFGAPDAPRIGLISDTETGGPFFQAIGPGRFTRALPSFGGDGIDSSVTRNGDLPVVAYRDLNGTTFVKSWSGQGDIHDPGTWSTATIPNTEDPLLASGPKGVYLMTAQADTARDHVVRSFTPPSTFGPPVKVSDSNTVGRRDFFQDPSGTLFATFVDSATDRAQLVARSSSDGRRWSARSVLAQAAAGSDVWSSDLGAAGDGGGFAIAHLAPGGAEGPIVAARFGEAAATGQPGLGSLAGGVADPTIVERCQRLEFVAVDIVAPEGCLLSAADRPGVKVSEGTIRLNGLELVPDSGVKIIINARARTIDSTGDVTVQLHAPGTSPVVLAKDILHIKLPSGGPPRESGGCRGQLLHGFDGGRAVLKGFPIAGTIEPILQEDSVCIPISLELPKVFGGVRGDATLRASNQRGLHLESLDIRANTIALGPVLMRDLRISYKAAGDEWTGGANLTFPPGWTAGATVTFRAGEFRGASITLGFHPGIPIFSGVFLNRVTAGFKADPLELTAGVRVGAFPLPAYDVFVIAVDGRLVASFGDPFRLEIGGSLAILGFNFASAEVVIRSDGYFHAKAGLRINLKVISVAGTAEIFVDGPNEAFGGSAEASVAIFGFKIGNAEVVLSSKALGVCGPSGIPFIDAGFVIVWGEEAKPLWGDCDLDEYKVPLNGRRAVRAAQAGSINVPANTPTTSLRVTGQGGVPSVVVVTPAGERVTPSAAGGPGVQAVAVASPDENATYVALPQPAAGTWRVEAAPDSVPIAGIGSANALPDPKVTGELSRASRTARTLKWRFANAEGRTLTFVEKGVAGERVIGTGNGTSGTIRFLPGEGPKGKRTIAAVVNQNDTPRHRIELGSYTSPGPPKPGPVRRVTARRVRKGVAVSWPAVPGAPEYIVRADVSDGRRLAFVTSKRTLRIKDIARFERVRVRVQVRGRNGRLGRAVRARPV